MSVQESLSFVSRHLPLLYLSVNIIVILVTTVLVGICICRLEQELMARLLMRMYPVMESAEQAEHNQEECNKSESIPDDESLLGEGSRCYL